MCDLLSGSEMTLNSYVTPKIYLLLADLFQCFKGQELGAGGFLASFPVCKSPTYVQTYKDALRVSQGLFPATLSVWHGVAITPSENVLA